MTIEQAIDDLMDASRSIAEVAESESDEANRINAQNVADDCKQLAAWLRELKERRKAPEIVTCYECKHYTPVSQTSNSWGKCSVHSSPTEKQRTCQSCDYCSWAERRTE